PRAHTPPRGEPRKLCGEDAAPASRAANEQRVAGARVDNGEGRSCRATRDSKGGSGTVVDAVRGMVRVGDPRDAPWRIYHDVVGDCAGAGAAEHSVANRELGHVVTDL